MKHKTTWIILGIALLGIVFGCMVYPNAPDEVVVHWGVDGNANGTAPKIFLILFPLFIVVLDMIMLVCRKIDPKASNYKKFSSSYDTIRLVTACIIFACYLFTLIEAIHPNTIKIQMMVILLISAAFVVMGNKMPLFRPNYFAGIRTPWTLSDDIVWLKTHRFSGRIWFIGGLCMSVCAFLNGHLAFVFIMIIVSLLIIIPFLYSYIVYRQRRR